MLCETVYPQKKLIDQRTSGVNPGKWIVHSAALRRMPAHIFQQADVWSIEEAVEEVLQRLQLRVPGVRAPRVLRGDEMELHFRAAWSGMPVDLLAPATEPKRWYWDVYQCLLQMDLLGATQWPGRAGGGAEMELQRIQEAWHGVQGMCAVAWRGCVHVQVVHARPVRCHSRS